MKHNNLSAIKKFLIHVKNKELGDDISGATVMINVNRILSRRDISKRFIDFVIANKDKKFTAKLETGYKTMYVLEEDATPVKWLFHIDDLLLIK